LRQGRTLATCTAVALLAGSVQVWVDDPDWGSMSYTSHAEYQAVDANGFGTFPMTDPVKMRGVILNRSEAMLDPAPGAPGFLGGLWQVYVQTVDADDSGGTACWMGQYIGKILGTHPEGSYTDAEWLAELDRLTHDPLSGHEFQPGDLVEVRARAPGLHFRGKNNVNEQHSNDPAADFDVYLLEANHGLPTPTVLTLADLKDGNDDFIFDPDRLVGCEHYQAALVRINEVDWVDTNGWAPDGELSIQDGTGRTFPVKLGLGDGYNAHEPPAGPFDVVGILDQEDLDSDDGHMDGYRAWVTQDYDGNGSIVPASFPLTGDLDDDGDVDLDDYAVFADCLNGPGNSPASGCPSGVNGDLDDDEDVDLSDFAIFACKLTANR